MSSIIKTREVVKTLGDVLTATENITVGAAKKLALPANDLNKFEADVKANIQKTRDELNKVQIDQQPPATPSPVTPPPVSPPVTPPVSPPVTPPPVTPPPVTPPVAPPPKSTSISTQTNSLPPLPPPPQKRLRSPRDKLQLLRILYESLINTINDLLKHIKSGNNDLIRRILGYIQILLLQLQHIVMVFNSFDERMGKLEDTARLNNRSEPINPIDLEKLRGKLELLRGIPNSSPIKSGWGLKNLKGRFFKGFGAIGGKMKSTRKRTPRRTTKRRGTRSCKK